MAGYSYVTTDTTSSTWSAWADQGTLTSATTGTTWTSWATSGTSTTTTSTVWNGWTATADVYAPRRTTPERQALDEAALAASRARAQRLAQEEAEAKERADKLLREHLSAEQKAQLEKENGFEVESASGKKYLITRGRAGNVYSLDAKRRKVAKHCIHPVEYCPDQDTMLAQLLWLKWNEEEFLRVANTTRLAA